MLDKTTAQEKLNSVIQELREVKVSDKPVEFKEQETLRSIMQSAQSKMLYEFDTKPLSISLVDEMILASTNTINEIISLASVHEELSISEELFQYAEIINDILKKFSEVKNILLQHQMQQQRITPSGSDAQHDSLDSVENEVYEGPPGGVSIQQDEAESSGYESTNSRSSADSQDRFHFDASDLDLGDEEEVKLDGSTPQFHDVDTFDELRGGDDIISDIQTITFHAPQEKKDPNILTDRDMVSIIQLIRIEITSDVTGIFYSNLKEKDSDVQLDVIHYLEDKYSNSTHFVSKSDMEETINKLDDLEILSPVQSVIKNVTGKDIDNESILSQAAEKIRLTILSELKVCKAGLNIKSMQAETIFNLGCKEFRRQIDKYFELRSKEEKPNPQRLKSISGLLIRMAELQKSGLTEDEKCVTFILLLQKQLNKVKANHKSGLLGFMKIRSSHLMQAYRNVVKSFPKNLVALAESVATTPSKTMKAKK